MTPVDRAYILAGYRDTQWARPNGSRLAHEPSVAKRIEELRDEFKASAGLSVEYLQRLLLPTAEANMLDFFEFKDGRPVLKKLEDLKREQGAAVAAVKVGNDGTIAVKLHNKNEAVNALLRSIGGVVDRLEITDQRFENMSDDELFADLWRQLLGLSARKIPADLLDELQQAFGIKVEDVKPARLPSVQGGSGNDRGRP